jgi:hypothetical protein
MNPTGRYAHIFEEEKGKIYRNDNRDPYKEEIKIPPPDHSQKYTKFLDPGRQPGSDFEVVNHKSSQVSNSTVVEPFGLRSMK